MIFSHDDIKLTLLDAAEFDYKKCNVSVAARGHCALSYRICSDAVLGFKNKTVAVGDGSVTFFPAGLPYTRSCTRDRMLVLHLDVQGYVGYDLQTVAGNEQIREHFERIIDIWSKKQQGYRYDAQAELYRLFGYLYREFGGRARPPQSIAPAVESIHEYYTDPQLTVNALARDSGVSEVYFRRVFREHFGVSPKQYITDLRIECAKSLLRLEGTAVDEVAVRCGFSEPKHFSVAFRKKVGTPPSEYRKNR